MGTLIILAAIAASAFVAGFFARDWANRIDHTRDQQADIDARHDYLRLQRIFNEGDK